MFHEKCIEGWLGTHDEEYRGSNNTACPCCREDVADRSPVLDSILPVFKFQEGVAQFSAIDLYANLEEVVREALSQDQKDAVRNLLAKFCVSPGFEN